MPRAARLRPRRRCDRTSSARSADEIAGAAVADDVDGAIDDAIAHLRVVQRAADGARRATGASRASPGCTVGEKITPITSAGLFVPSGKASYPSVAYQLGVPAIVAGVPQVALVVPPVPDGSGRIDPAVLVVCRKLGIDNVFRVNGPAGVAALGFGTESIPQVRKIVGPGSPPVACAQVEMQRYGVATMMILGPTESVVIADDSADPRFVAADLLNEAEHGTDSAVLLVTDVRPHCATRSIASWSARLAELPPARAEAARAALGVERRLRDRRRISPRRATSPTAGRPSTCRWRSTPRAEAELLDLLVNAGEILIGQHTLFSAGNFVIGCPASLPTGGFAHVSSGITADAFLKRTAVARADDVARRRMTPTIVAMSRHEGFPAHANAAPIRSD